MVRQAVRDILTAPPPPPTEPPTNPTIAALRHVVDDLAASTHVLGELMKGRGFEFSEGGSAANRRVVQP
ncbi:MULTISPECIES: hypothetical protein [Streptomyces]|uniref:hypothetical protein n=1 Tax=Streptomyces TaxID=1883 RepID=UPI0031EF2C1D